LAADRILLADPAAVSRADSQRDAVDESSAAGPGCLTYLEVSPGGTPRSTRNLEIGGIGRYRDRPGRELFSRI